MNESTATIQQLIHSMSPEERIAFGSAYMKRLQERKKVEYNVEELFTPLPCTEWMQRFFFIPELEGPIQLYPHQILALNEALRLLEDGSYAYSTVVWSDIKKSAKSVIAAGVVLWLACQRKRSMIRIIANDLKQADSRVAYYARRAIELNPALGLTCRVKPSGYTIKLTNGSIIEAVPIDPKGEAGGNDDLIVYSELWAATSEAAQQMWTETTTSPTKFGKAMRWVETYSGYSGESPILEPLYSNIVKEGVRLDNDVEMFAKGRSFALWNTTPRLPWQSPEYYAQQEGELLPNEFLRVHRNQWVSSLQSFVDALWWDACKKDTIEPLQPRELCVFSLDAAVSGDCFGLLGLVGRNGLPHKVYSHKWTPPSGGTINYGPIEDECRRLAKEYNVVEFTYDPFQLHDFATRLMRDGVAAFRPFTQGEERLRADKALWDRIRDRRIVHEGDVALREHILNANAKLEGDNKMRIVKRASHLKIDLAVCLSMACSEGQRLGLYE